MKHKQYIKVKSIPKKEKKTTNYEEQDKIARLYARAEKLNVKIGG